MSDDTEGLLAAIRSSPEGTFKLFRATEQQPEVEQSIANRSELASRIEHAKRAHCLIEVISLRIQHMDLWLRIFYENRPHESKRQREFGRLLRQCCEVGLDKSLYDRIHDFNEHRMKAIHGYLVGATSYEHLEKVVRESDGLSESLAEYVLMNSGEVVTEAFPSQRHERGDAVYNVPALLARLRSGTPL